MKYLSISEYAKHFKVSRPTVYKRIKNGSLLSLKIEGGHQAVIVEDTEYASVNLK